MVAPLPLNENERLETLRRYAILDTAPEAAFDRIASLASRLLKTPVAAVTMVDAARQWFKASYGMKEKETSRDVAFCAHTILNDEVMIVPDATLDERFFDNPLVTEHDGIRFYAGIPLKVEGANIGALCVIDKKSRTFDITEQAILRDLAEIAVDELHLRMAMIRKNELMTALQDSLEKLQKLEILRDNLTNMIVHDMRSPLSTTIGFLEIAKLEAGDALPPATLEALSYAASGAEQLRTMVTSLLDVSRLESGAMPIEMSDCNLADVARTTLANRLALKEESRLLLDMAAAHVPVRCDANLVSRTIMNLVDNALKFSPKGGTVLVKVSQEPTSTRLSVIDSGPGISREHQAKVFDKFSQIQGTRHLHSTGLGLTFCKLAIEAQGGTIGIESEEGHGSTFWIRLPNGEVSSSPAKAEHTSFQAHQDTAGPKVRDVLAKT